MNSAPKSLTLIVAPVRRFLADEIQATELVNIVDDLVSNDRLSDLSPSLTRLIDDFHVSLALYVPDKQERQKEKAYIGESELRTKAAEFTKAINAIYPSAPF